jgi:hypothetical protein
MSWHWDQLTSAGDGAPLVTNDTVGLASHVFDAEGTQHVFYRSVDNHIIELWWRGADAAHPGDLMRATGGKAPLAASDPASHVFAAEGTQHVFYRTADGHIIELWWRGGEAPHWGSLMNPTAPLAVGNPASHVFAVEGSQHVFYRTGDGHIIELWWQGPDAAQPENLNIESGGAPLAWSDPISHVSDAEGTQHVFYTSVDFDIIEIWWRRGEGKQFANLTKRSGGAPPSAGRPTSHVFAAEGTQHVFYTSVESHVIELRWGNGQFPPWRDLLGLDSAQVDVSRPTSLVFAADGAAQQVFYSGPDLDIRRLGLQGEEKPTPQDLMIASGGAPRAIGDPISHVFAAEGTQHVFYTTGDGHVVELWWQKA